MQMYSQNEPWDSDRCSMGSSHGMNLQEKALLEHMWCKRRKKSWVKRNSLQLQGTEVCCSNSTLHNRYMGNCRFSTYISFVKRLPVSN